MDARASRAPVAFQPGTDSGYHTAFKAWVLEKTFKREVAIAVLLFWFIITVRVFWFTDHNAIRALDSAYGTVTTTIWMYVVAAFGMDWVSKQMADPKTRERYKETLSGSQDEPGVPVRRRLAPQPPGETDPSIPPKGYGN